MAITDKQVAKTLLDFYLHYKKEVNNPNRHPRVELTGLCHNLEIFLAIERPKYKVSTQLKINKVQRKRLILEYGTTYNPFGDRSFELSDGHHKNPKRIAFVDSEIERLTKLLNK